MECIITETEFGMHKLLVLTTKYDWLDWGHIIFTLDFSGGRLFSRPAPYVPLSVRLPVISKMLSLYSYLVHALAITWFWSLIMIMVGLRQISHFIWDFYDIFWLKADRRSLIQRMAQWRHRAHDISIYKWWQNDERRRILLFKTLSHLANHVRMTSRSQTSLHSSCFTKFSYLRILYLKVSLCFCFILQ